MKIFKGGDLGTGLAIGLGTAILAPIILPLLAAALKPLVKSGMKAGILAYEQGKLYMEEAKENFEDLAAEARSELKEAEKAKLPEAAPKRHKPAASVN